ncbi:unnamed protein product [Fusarium graminearum]|uniref:Nucleoside 2-deoxyribosyltransferase n=1 Tax=Gibberella zeae TaxID=5518 RepID=A0A4U9ERD5_GIBZA|nr:unnamed protein product [Fusarium graminearum]CAF3613314.1 unnamed protein product [Fusarium graminearum]CAF3638220.1 unnamed protein product [Fusarium graminearum]CAG1965893.1 unnamed protein product [Fusarium graminearum]CAG1989847.1 unnamed protein product [Fusarium graminearum]
MTSQAIVVMAPQSPNLGSQVASVFLAGTTTSTGNPDWRQVVTGALANYPITILNPNRPDWDSTWREDFSDNRWVEQVSWELDMQEAADIIVFMLHEVTEAPISLMELGLAVRTKSVIVCAHPNYRKRGNVDAVCRMFGVKLLSTQEELVDCLIETLEEVKVTKPKGMLSS